MDLKDIQDLIERISRSDFTCFEIELDGTGSSDPDNDPLIYSWSTDCPDGAFDDEFNHLGSLNLLYVDGAYLEFRYLRRGAERRVGQDIHRGLRVMEDCVHCAGRGLGDHLHLGGDLAAARRNGDFVAGGHAQLLGVYRVDLHETFGVVLVDHGRPAGHRAAVVSP